MKNNYKISKKALFDLKNIWKYTKKKWSKEQADRYYILLTSEIVYISNNILSGKNFENYRENYRTVNVKSHIIFYRIRDNNCIEIVRILNQRMDLKSRLND